MLWDHCWCFDCSAAFHQDNNVWFVCDSPQMRHSSITCNLKKKHFLLWHRQWGWGGDALKSRPLCSLHLGQDEVDSAPPTQPPQDQSMLWCQRWKWLSYDAKFLFIPLEFWTSVLLSPLYTAGSDGIPITSHRLVLTSSLVINTDHRLQSDCFQPLTGFNNCGTAVGSYSQKHVRKSRYSVSFGTRNRSMHSARADFPTPKQELTLLERDFLLVLRLGAQIGI